jgi:hypothetical protein
MKSLIHVVFGKLLLVTAALLILGTVYAQNPGDQSKETAAAVKYLGSDEDMIVFNVSYPNPDGNKFQIIIKDQDGTQLYQHFFSERSFYRQFRLPKADEDRIVFVIRDNAGEDIVKTFEVNVNSRYVREVAVKKL